MATQARILSRPAGFEQLTSLNAAAGLTPPANATVAVFCARTQDVNYRDDGTDPTASVGITLKVGVPFVYDGNLNAIKFFEATASAKLDVAYYAAA